MFFDEVRWWTYDNHTQHTDRDQWIEAVRTQAQVIYAELAADLPNFSLKPHKITEIADECAAWTWEKMRSVVKAAHRDSVASRREAAARQPQHLDR